jgi:excisionase family DNA binding protein
MTTTTSAQWEAVMQAEDLRAARANAAIQRDRGKYPVAVPRLLLRREEAARALNISLDHFERYVQPHLALVRCGRLRLVPIGELRKWVELHSERVPA